MINTYEEFEDRLIKMAQVRLRNYAESDCDIKDIISTVYHEIASEIRLAWRVQEFVMNEEPTDNDVYCLPDSDMQNLDPKTVTEMYVGIYDIVDEFGNDVSAFFQLDEKGCLVPNDEIFKKEYKGDTIYVLRGAIRDITMLEPHLYPLL